MVLDHARVCQGVPRRDLKSNHSNFINAIGEHKETPNQWARYCMYHLTLLSGRFIICDVKTDP